MPERFSEREGLRPSNAEITVRHDAPPNLRYAVVAIAGELGLRYSNIREVICHTLRVRPDSYNWSEIPNIRDEVYGLLEGCEWYKVYDIAEALQDSVCPQHSYHWHNDECKQFEKKLNQVFYEKGIGWKMKEGKIVFRGANIFEETIEEVTKVLDTSDHQRALREMREALRDISRRPDPDITGAIQHACAGLEATARYVLNEPDKTLGALVSQLPLPEPLEIAVDKLWGYASQNARHMDESKSVDVNITDAELLVNVAGAVCIYLVKRIPG